MPEEDGSGCCGCQAPQTLRALFVQEGKVLGESQPLCPQRLGLGQWPVPLGCRGMGQLIGLGSRRMG